jgi:DNA-binding MurR/RpiR family transcriptional regulator
LTEEDQMNLNLDDPRTIGPRIRMMMPHLTPMEARVVEMMLGRRDFSEDTPLREVARSAVVSDAMVVKIAKKLGFSGYRDFRTGLVEYRNLPTADLHQEVSPEDSSAEIVQKVFRTAINALEETLSILDPDAFDRAVDLIHGARQRDFYGIGGSAQIARDVAHKFLRIGIRASVFDDAHMMLMSASLLGPDDVAIGFSHSGSTTAVLEPLMLARRRGARTIAVTNYGGSPIAQVAEVVLCSTAQGSPLLGENAAARIAQLNILDAVFAAVAQRNLAAAEANLASTMGAVREKRRR